MSTFMELGKILGVDNFSLHVINEIDTIDEELSTNISSKRRTELRQKKLELTKIKDYYINWLNDNK